MRIVYLLAAALFALPAVADEGKKAEVKKAAKKLISGIPPGTGMPSFAVKDVTGRYKKSPAVCYI